MHECANFGMKKIIHPPRWYSGTDCTFPHCLNTRRCTRRCPPVSGRPGGETQSGSASEAWTWARSCHQSPVCGCKRGCTPPPAFSLFSSCTTQTRPRWSFRSCRAKTPLRSHFLWQTGARRLQNKKTTHKRNEMYKDILSLSLTLKLWVVQYITCARGRKSQREKHEQWKFPSSHAGQDMQVWVETGSAETCWREVRTFAPTRGHFSVRDHKLSVHTTVRRCCYRNFCPRVGTIWQRWGVKSGKWWRSRFLPFASNPNTSRLEVSRGRTARYYHDI